jgi:hypothetical protein
MHRMRFSTVVTIFLISVSLKSYAAPPPVEFSAEAIQTSPQGQEMHQKMYLGADGRVRIESSAQGQNYVQIINPATGKMYMLLPAQKTYMERVFDGAAQLKRVTADPNPNPCAGVPNAKCKMLGKDTVNGRAAEKWELVQEEEGGQTERMLYWLDSERRMPLRQFMPDGSTTEMEQVGSEVMNGRQTEIWKMTMTRPGEEDVESTQWYDPELKIAIRDELPGGAYRELRNIKIQKQPADLFEVPGDYKKVAAPQQGGQPQRGTPPYGQRR